MGTGVSRLNVLMSCGPFQPVGHNRIDEMQSKGLQRNTPSTKLLLLNNNINDQEDGAVTPESSNNDVTASCKNTSNNFICFSSSQDGLLVALDSTKDKERESTLKSEEGRGGRYNNINVIIVNNNHDEDEQEHEQEEEERNSDYEGSLWIRSPSFRDYVRVVHSDDDDEDGLSNTNESVEKEENQQPAAKKYGNNEVCIMRRGAKAITSMSKGIKQRRIRKVFSEKSSGMKHLWKVNICYNPKVPHSGPGEAPAKSSSS